MFRKIIALIGIFIFFITTFSVLAESTPTLTKADLFSEIAISIEANTGEIIFEKNAHKQAFPASITKVMTAILLLEYVEEDELITMTEESLHEVRSNSIIEFAAGEQMDRDTALDFLMMLSANDVATSIAEHIAGSKEAFGKLMTQKAQELGAINTNFINASGLHEDNHFTTAYDMALIVREVMNSPILMEAMSTERKTVTTSKQTLTIPNRSIMFKHKNFYAGKTGFTRQAGNTLVEVSEKNGVYIINVVMRSANPMRYEDIEKLASYGFSQIEQRVVVDKSQWHGSLEFLGKEISASIEKNVQIPAVINSEPDIETTLHQREFSDDELYNNGINIGDEVGQMDVIVNGNIIDTVQVLANENVEFNKPFFTIIKEGMETILQLPSLSTTLYVISVLVGIVLIIRIINITRRKRRRKRRKDLEQWR